MEKERKNTRRNRGITLIALVITVIILLILAGISIAELTGTGIFVKAEEAKQKYKEAEDLENEILANYETQLNRLGKSTVGSGSVTGGGDDDQKDDPKPSEPNTPATSMEEAKSEDMFEKTVNSTVQDDYDNQVVVPAGFKITDDASNVTEGIVIIDQQGNEFVWVPVGTITDSSKSTHTITLSRYTFDTNGSPSNKGTTQIDGTTTSSKHEERSTSTSGNSKAKDLAGFRDSVEKNHGYYIGRYEARTGTERTTEGAELTTVTEKGTDYVYNYVTQPQASQQCQAMYSDNINFTSDLINSYAWDTTIIFLQKFDNRTTDRTKKYSRQNSLNTGSLATTGTNNTNTVDKICNIYDMASNMYEYTTEHCTDTGNPSTVMGGYYNNISRSTCTRGHDSRSKDFNGFRPILYCSVES